MNLKQRFLTQSIFVLIGTIIITTCVGFAYAYFFNLFNNSSVTAGLNQREIVVMENDNIVYKSEDFSIFQVKEMLMNISVKDNSYEYENKKYTINEDNFTNQDGDKYKIITLNQMINTGDFYRVLIIFVFTTFIIVFLIANLIVQKQNIKNIIIPITNLTKEMEKLRIGELETSITDNGYGEVRELGSAIEQLRLQLKNSIYYQQRVDENRKFLISSISHDLKTPVTSIRGYIDGVLDGIADTDEKKHYYLSKAIEKTKMINKMIEDLLLYSKLDLNQIPFEKEKVDIVKYMEDCVEDSLTDFKRENKRIILENELSTSPFIIIDGSKFKRVLQNIIDNAKRSIEEQTGQLNIILRETNSSIIIEFKDNGQGISKEDLPNVFERFYRADMAREVKGSSGLGLAIAKQIVEGLGGRIWAVSEIGQGASIIISLKKVKNEEVTR
ncbi:HAMP domain-containing sensor histidine kinase [Tissierella sp. Yu-01]|uniref:sensor histidine kinase n=1 Tax=Tissierella sp. Yu-01 TaxID=3035694 RepID=UPI00240E55AB|nr:HAMP domain-containing sensor histidine kinase [Tissierella sp. Yu-01]WFA09104.1 HAMP domain-containing sensor histidine kinase [Tissierella sp. Yu-01]